MWTIAPVNPQPLAPPVAVPFALLMPAAVAPIALLDIAVAARDTSIAVPLEPATAIATTATTANGQTTLAAPLAQVDAIVWAGQTFTPVEDPDNPQANEFTRSGSSIELPATVQPSADLPIVAIGGSERIPTDLIDGSVLAPLVGLPVMGKLSWSEALEQPPSGSIALVCFPDDLPAVRSRLKKGTELKLFDRGWSVASFSETFKDDYYEVSVSLTGRWEAAKYQRPVRLRSNTITGASTSPIEPDPDCANGISTVGATATTGGLTVASIAARAGVPFRSTGAFWSVPVAPDTPPDATASWSDLARDRVRLNHCYLDTALHDAVYARSIDAGARWRYGVKEISTTYQGETRNSPDYRGYAVEYANAALNFNPTGGINGQPLNRPVSQKPLWVPRQRKKLTLASGDADAAQMPAQTDWLKTLSLNWDASGPTKTLKISTTEDGMPSEEEEFIYGFCYEARSIVNGEGELRGAPGAFWRLVSYKRTTHLYDSVYGYALGSDTTGWRMGRFRQESDDALETIAYNDGQSGQYLALYQFRRIPLRARTRLLLESFASTYNDVDESGAMVGYKVCNIDGTSRMAWMRDPTWVPAMYILAEMTYTNSFASLPNPDSGDTPDSKLPPLTTGEESSVCVSRQIVPSKTTSPTRTPSNVVDLSSFSQENDFDRYIERKIEDSAQGASFKDKAVHESFTENEGRPPAATRRPPTLERKEAEPDTADDREEGGDRTLEYTICTPGYRPTDSSEGSISFEARTPQTAFIAAQADLKIRDIQQSVQYKFVVPPNARIRPMDFMQVVLPHETLKTRVVSVAHEYNFEGMTDGMPIVTAVPTSITAGIDRTIPCTLHSKARSDGATTVAPTPPQADDLPPLVPGVVDRNLTLGQLIDGTWITRRNF